MATISREKNIPVGTFTHNRKDNWWLSPGLAGLVLATFVVYTVLALFAFDKNSYHVGNYLSPIFGVEVPEFIKEFLNWPEALPAALLTIWAPVGFRATCYYMRKIYYRSIFGNPPACAVNGVNIRRGKYTGERMLPFILNNFHRYFLYASIVIASIHWLELPNAFNFGGKFGMGIGTIILLADTIFLTLYITSCHAFRHLIGGGTNCYSCSTVKGIQYKGWKIVSKINQRHGTWFWFSLTTVLVADIFIRLVFYNVIQDIVFFTL
jgi:hypothetical protein